jgi:dephospho-CoA kinase
MQHAAEGAPLVVFDIPLLYETHAEQQLDLVLVVSAPADVQQQRVLARTGMTPEKLAAILARQVRGSNRCACGASWLAQVMCQPPVDVPVQ